MFSFDDAPTTLTTCNSNWTTLINSVGLAHSIKISCECLDAKRYILDPIFVPQFCLKGISQAPDIRFGIKPESRRVLFNQSFMLDSTVANDNDFQTSIEIKNWTSTGDQGQGRHIRREKYCFTIQAKLKSEFLVQTFEGYRPIHSKKLLLILIKIIVFFDVRYFKRWKGKKMEGIRKKKKKSEITIKFEKKNTFP